MNAIRTDATVDETLAQAVPASRPLLGRHIEIIALEVEGPAAPRGRLTFDAFLATRLARPEGVESVSLDDMERAIAEGATGRALR